MKCWQLLLLLGLTAVNGAQVYMEFNGHKYAYNTDKEHWSGRQALSPNYYDYQPEYEPVALQPVQFVHQSLRDMQMYQPTYFNQGHSPPQATSPNFDFTTPQMSHAQHTDEAGNILGKYSYYDAAGYHELSYKAGAGIGFVVMGGNLAKATDHQQTEIQSVDSHALSSATHFGNLHRRFV